MQAEDFSSDAPGGLVRNLDGRLTFVPNPLPGPLRLDPELVTLLNEAERGLGRVAGVAETLPNPAIVTRAFVRREAQLSSRIENVHTSYADLAVAGLRPATVEKSDAVIEVLNNEEALNFALAAMRDGRNLNATLIRQMHAILLRDTRGAEKQPGRYRDRQVFIGAGDAIDDAVFVPPPPHAVPDLMDALDKWLLTRPPDMPLLARNAMVHYQFETIHPFLDGNGRTGRAIILLMMCADGQLPQPTLNPSLHMERNRPEYYRRLREVSTLNKWSAWVKFFARSVAAAAADAARRIEAIRQLQARYHAQLRQRGRSALLLTLVDELFIDQAIDIPRAAERLGGVKYDTAARHVATLMEAGILTEITGRGRDRIFVAGEIIDAIQS